MMTILNLSGKTSRSRPPDLEGTEEIRPYIPILLTYILRFSQEGGVYKRFFWASASSETCAPGGSYFVYSVFFGVTLACLMHSPESPVS
jgi:hypothetical protein